MKSWYESKTIWLGLATIVTAVVSGVSGGAGWQQAVLAAVGAELLRIGSERIRTVRHALRLRSTSAGPVRDGLAPGCRPRTARSRGC
jgi:hypothetical protein